MKWVDEITMAMRRLGGAARYADLYEFIEKTTSRTLTAQWKASVRRTVENFSSDSANFSGKDLFRHVGRGFWALRGEAFDPSLIDERDKIQPAEVVRKVLVREHLRTIPGPANKIAHNITRHTIAAAPDPVAPYSHAVESDGWVFLTGLMPNDPADTSVPLAEGIEAQTARVMENLRIVLEELGLGFEHVVQARCYLTEFRRDYAAFNATYRGFFAPGALPARTTVGVTALALDALVEIEMVARRPSAASIEG